MTEDIEKGLVTVAGKVLAFFRGLFGRWVTVGGRPVFIKIKGIVKGDVAVKDARAAALAFKKLPRNMRVGLGKVRVSNRNIIERLLPEKTPPFLLGKELFQVSKIKIKSTVDFVFPSAPTIILRPGRKGVGGIAGKPFERGYLSRGKFLSIPDDAVETESFIRGPGYTTVPVGKKQRIFVPFFPKGPKEAVTTSTQLTIFPGRLRALASLKVATRRKGRRRFPGVDVQDIVNRSAGRSIFPTFKTNLSEGLTFAILKFEETVARERGVTRYAERLRRQFIARGAQGASRNGATENFAEIFMIFSRRNSKFKTQWEALQRSHPETIKRFFALREIFGIVE